MSMDLKLLGRGILRAGDQLVRRGNKQTVQQTNSRVDMLQRGLSTIFLSSHIVGLLGEGIVSLGPHCLKMETNSFI